jgi:pimeloyl-ACP methyl ester carboxylesterase
MSAMTESFIEISGNRHRIWTKGEGPLLGFIAGVGGLTRWTRFLDALANQHTVIVPALPGFPGGGSGHLSLDTQLDWLLALRQVLDGAGLSKADLVGSNIGGAFVADIAAVWPNSVRRIALIAPHGLYLDAHPPADLWAQRPGELGKLLCASEEGWMEQRTPPSQVTDTIEWTIEQNRASEAAARLSWPLGNTGLAKRLHHINAPTQLIWGSEDKVLSRAYADYFAARIAGPTERRVIDNAGHLAELDQPEAVARAIVGWFGSE